MTHRHADRGPSRDRGLDADHSRFDSLRIPAIAGDLGPRALPSARRRLALAWIAPVAGSPTTLLAMPASIGIAAYANATGYGQSVANFTSIPLAKGDVVGDDTAVQPIATTPPIAGDPTNGHLAVATVGIAR